MSMIDQSVVDSPAKRDSAKQSVPNRKIVKWVFWTVVFSSAVTTLLWVMVCVWMYSRPEFSMYTDMVDKYVLKSPVEPLEPYISYQVGELVQNGVIISLDDYLSLQSSFYGTVITILIALIGLLGAAAYFVVRHSSEDSSRTIAREISSQIAMEQMDHFVNSQKFHEILVANVKVRLGPYEADMDAKFQAIEEQNEKIGEISDRLSEQEEHIKNIAEAISKLDKEEQSDSSIRLTPPLFGE